MKIKIICIIAIGFLILGCEYLTDSEGNSYDYICVNKANSISKEADQLAHKMELMGCNEIISNDALYTRCMELYAEHKLIYEEWELLPCTVKN